MYRFAKTEMSTMSIMHESLNSITSNMYNLQKTIQKSLYLKG